MTAPEPVRLAPVLIVTASARWMDRDAIRVGLTTTLDMIGAPKGPATDGSMTLLRHGGGLGGERIASQIWAEWVEAGIVGPATAFHLPTKYSRHVARAMRDDRMMHTRPEPRVCIGFPVGASPRERACMDAARLAGILVIDLGRGAF